jgi:hypothetical protein
MTLADVEPDRARAGTHRYRAALAVTSAAVCMLVVAAPVCAGPDPPVNTAPPTVAGTPQYQQTLTAQGGSWTGTQPITTAFQWERCQYDQYPAAVEEAGPLSYWELGDAAGSPAYDSFGEADGTYSGGVTLGSTGALADDADSAATFDGATGYVDIPGVQFDSADFSIEAWFKTALPGVPGEFPGRIWSSGYVGGPQGVEVTVRTSSILFQLSDAAGNTVALQSPGGYSDGNWHHVVAVRSGTSFLLYVDGAQTASATGSLGDVDASSASARIGAAVPPVTGEDFDGDLDEISIYTRSLTGTEIAERYREGLGTACSDVAGATASTYTLGAADAGFSVRVVETATNAGGTASAASTQSGPVTALLTYQDLQAAGLPLPETPSDYGLPACPEDLDWPGYATVDELEAAIAEAPDDPTCADDPTHYLFSTSRPNSESGQGSRLDYRHAGAVTVTRYQGGAITVEVADPDVPHPGPPGALEQVEARVLATPAQTTNAPWQEVGWIETSTDPNDARHIYEYEHPGDPFIWISPRRPRDGRAQAYRVRDCPQGACADYFWDGKWQRIPRANHHMHCKTRTRSRNCFVEEYLEVSSNDGHWPDLDAPLDGQGVDFYATHGGELRTAPLTWIPWDESIPTQPSNNVATTPYVTCWLVLYYRFKVGKTGLC